MRIRFNDYQKSDEMSDVKETFNNDNFYLNGIGVEKDEDKAFNYAIPYNNPPARTQLMSGLASDKIYYFGGYGNTESTLNDIFYIYLTQPFYNFYPKYQLVGLLDFRGGASAASDANNIYVFGGFSDSGTPKDELYIIHTDSLQENPIPNYVQETNSTPFQRKWHTSVIDNKKLYVWGGVRLTGLTESLGDGIMYIYDITQSVWTSNPTPNQPIGRLLHTATLLPDGRIIMIGGLFSSDVRQLDVYDTKTNQWTNITATKNDVIPPIVGHTATLLPDNQSILICGGSNQSEYSGLASLNASNYVWTVISPNGTNGTSPTSFFGGHVATLYANVIIFAFGGHPNNSLHPFNYVGTNNTVKILNISNDQYRWVDSFTPIPVAKQNAQASDIKIIIIIVPIIGVIVFIVILVLLLYFIHHKHPFVIIID
ncbi:hypothetical protein C2G38_2255648 [Gigaspora rosea]|uniref:Galactose oxidase n=1 Tax=Gigaspora rosea TaxID=44941 RepID=A0A397TWT6_9GLOM|nr:hypothetical protein C2G38_2255648 [Gigaspora rosea]